MKAFVLNDKEILPVKIFCPFLPAGRQEPRLSRSGGTGYLPAKSFNI